MRYNHNDMSKRKLSKHQQRRVSTRQQSIINDAIDNTHESEFKDSVGTIISHHGRDVDLEDENGIIVVCRKRQHLGPIVPGDKVIWRMQPSDKSGVVLAIKERSSLLSRPDKRGKLIAVAANVDQVFIVISPRPSPELTTIDRYLLAAESEKIQPIIVLNKEDLIKKSESDTLKIFDLYQKLGYPAIKTSSKELDTLGPLRAYLKNKISIFVGQSGVGKSSILSALLPNESIKTGLLAKIGQGMHTTTAARLFRLPEQPGSIIDSPGIREFPLWHMNSHTLADGFKEFRKFIGSCKYRNCKHLDEQGCAIISATENGKIDLSRLKSYQKILAKFEE